jgi:mannose-6-phosphate isomerase-like protein (cupin superfamily)
MKEKMKRGNFNEDIVKLAQKNDYFRRVLLTTELSQLVVMSIQPGEDIGEETHDGIDQILSIVSGAGAAMIEGVTSPVKAGSVVVVPAGTRHNFVNTGKESVKTLHGLRAARPQGRHRSPHQSRRADRPERTARGIIENKENFNCFVSL